MATKQDFETIEIIQQKVQQAKSNHVAPEDELTDGDLAYAKKALVSIRSALLWASCTVVLACVTIFALNIFNILVSGVAIPDSEKASFVGTALFLGAITIASFCLAIKAHTLEVTPTFMLVSLIFSLVANLLFFVGILPLVSVILLVIALCRFSTYKSWYYQLANYHGTKRKSSKGRAKDSDTTSLDATGRTSTIKIVLAAVIAGATALVAGVLIGSAIMNDELQAKYFSGYADGKNDYQDSGYTKGVNSGYQRGFADAQNCAAQIAREIDAFGIAVTTMDSCYKLGN